MTGFGPTKEITGEQIRGARAMLRLDQKQFATLLHISPGAVRRLERTIGPIDAADGLLEAIRVALDDAGIELIAEGHYSGNNGPGLRFRGAPIATDDVIDFDEAVQDLQETGQVLPDAS